MNNEFDFVIVGGGTAGCILANRLTENTDVQVMMLEAGTQQHSPLISIPAGFSKLMTMPKYNWLFHTQKESHLYNREIAVPRGKGLGGSSLINGMIYVRGIKQDYDSWKELGVQGWDFEAVQPYFKRIENFPEGSEERGHAGPMHITRVTEKPPIANAFIKAFQEYGIAVNEDYNVGAQEGVGYYQVLQHEGKRWSVVDGYIKPILHRKNLHICDNAFVKKIIFDGKRCVGVVYQKNGQEFVVRARKEVVLCAGTIQSAQLLEVSGIGNPEILNQLGVSVVHANNNVGENYIDHFATRMNWRINGFETLNESSRGVKLLSNIAKYYMSKKGILTFGTGLVHGFVKSTPDQEVADIQYFVIHASYANAADRKLDTQPGMTFGVSQLRPESMGFIHSQSPDMAVSPKISPNMLTAEIDQRVLVNGMKIARQIVNTPSFKPHLIEEMSPGVAVDSDEQWLDFAKRNGQTIYHPIGTCRMGGNEEIAVVDSTLKVMGVTGLRIVDASVIPKMVSGNIQAAVMMVAEKGSDIIRKEYRL